MNLKKLPFALFILFLTCLKTEIHAQQLGLQINAGLMNYGGDLQTKVYTFNEAELTAGANLLYQVNNFVLRAGFTYGSIQGDDKKIQQFAHRNLNFKSTITEASLCLEYDFFSADKDRKLIPYIFAGIGVYHYNPYTSYNSQKVYLQPLGTEGEGLSIYPHRKIYSLTNLEDPFGVGVKYKLLSNLLIGIEFNSRYLYTDYLDDVSRTYPDENELFKQRGQLAVDVSFRGDEINPGLPYPSGNKRGNPKQNDNYYTSVITLTYLFFGNSLFGNSFGRNKHSLSCPKKVH
jgi:hypothetical protein